MGSKPWLTVTWPDSEPFLAYQSSCNDRHRLELFNRGQRIRAPRTENQLTDCWPLKSLKVRGPTWQVWDGHCRCQLIEKKVLAQWPLGVFQTWNRLWVQKKQKNIKKNSYTPWEFQRQKRWTWWTGQPRNGVPVVRRSWWHMGPVEWTKNFWSADDFKLDKHLLGSKSADCPLGDRRLCLPLRLWTLLHHCRSETCDAWKRSMTRPISIKNIYFLNIGCMCIIHIYYLIIIQAWNTTFSCISMHHQCIYRYATHPRSTILGFGWGGGAQWRLFCGNMQDVVPFLLLFRSFPSLTHLVACFYSMHTDHGHTWFAEALDFFFSPAAHAMHCKIRVKQWQTWQNSRDRWVGAAEIVQELFIDWKKWRKIEAAADHGGAAWQYTVEYRMANTHLRSHGWRFVLWCLLSRCTGIIGIAGHTGLKIDVRICTQAAHDGAHGVPAGTFTQPVVSVFVGARLTKGSCAPCKIKNKKWKP